MAKNNAEKPKDASESALRSGLWVFLVLAILTIGEFISARIAPELTIILWVFAIWKAFTVVKDYMHIGRLFRDEEAH